MIFWSNFSLDINKLACKPSKTKEIFFPLVPLRIISKNGLQAVQFKNLAIDKLFDLICCFLHHSFITKT